MGPGKGGAGLVTARLWASVFVLSQSGALSPARGWVLQTEGPLWVGGGITQRCGQSVPASSVVPLALPPKPGRQTGGWWSGRRAQGSRRQAPRRDFSPMACVDSRCCFSSPSRLATFILRSLVSVAATRERPFRGSFRGSPGPGGRFMLSAARTMVGHLGGALGRCWQAWPLHPAFSGRLPSVCTSLGLHVLPGGHREAQKRRQLAPAPSGFTTSMGAGPLRGPSCVSLPDGFCGGQRGASAGWGYQGGMSSQQFPSVTHRSV